MKELVIAIPTMTIVFLVGAVYLVQHYADERVDAAYERGFQAAVEAYYTAGMDTLSWQSKTGTWMLLYDTILLDSLRDIVIRTLDTAGVKP
jgi:hypothetical protein